MTLNDHFVICFIMLLIGMLVLLTHTNTHTVSWSQLITSQSWLFHSHDIPSWYFDIVFIPLAFMIALGSKFPASRQGIRKMLT